jgi:copper chaperone
MMTIQTYFVPAISCHHCVNAITGEVTKVAGVAEVAVDLKSKTVTVVGEADDAAIRTAIDDAGYDVAA